MSKCCKHSTPPVKRLSDRMISMSEYRVVICTVTHEFYYVSSYSFSFLFCERAFLFLASLARITHADDLAETLVYLLPRGIRHLTTHVVTSIS